LVFTLAKARTKRGSEEANDGEQWWEAPFPISYLRRARPKGQIIVE